MAYLLYYKCDYIVYACTHLFPTEGGRDYENPNSNTMVFERCQLKICVYISTIDDGTAEHSETFYAVLSRSSQLDGRIRLVNRETRVTINDNDGMSIRHIMQVALYSLYSLSHPIVAYVRLSDTVYTVDEGESARLCLLMDYIGDSRDCPYGYQFEVTVGTEDGTAGKLADQLVVTWILYCCLPLCSV